MGNAADLHAMMLQVMRDHAAIQPRGFDSIRARASLMAQWDDMYDDWLLESLVESESEPA
jgi:hypothetical protein